MDSTRTLKGQRDTEMVALRDRMVEAVTRHLGDQLSRETAISGMSIHGRTTPMEPASFLYDPSFAFIARGSKRVILGDETYVYDESHFLLTAVGLPTIVQVLGATETDPYISVKLDIDLELARELIWEVDERSARSSATGTGLAIGPVTPALASATMRMVELFDTPEDIPILARSLQREILYRVLISPVGERLRQAVQIGTQTNGVANAIDWIRNNFTRPIRIEELADVAGMAESTFHHQFRALTAMSPLQYQKHLRLHEARRLMLNERLDAQRAAHRVGYESATQFNREYRRMFGVPPKRDVKAMLSTSLESAVA